MKQVSRILLSAGAAVMALSACTKDLPYKEKYKAELQNKGAVDTKAEYLFSASVGQISRSSSDALPFSSGDNKRVKLEWSQDALRVIEIDRDARYRNNTTNNKTVLVIPVEHTEFECAKDRFGECTNADEERDIGWKDKAYFKFKDEATKSTGYELLPLLAKQVSKEAKMLRSDMGNGTQVGANPKADSSDSDDSSSNPCYNETDSRLLDVKLENDALNIRIERTFKVHPYCQESAETVSDATVSGVFHYSMVKVSSVLSEGFKPVTYPEADSQKFGFFSTERIVRDSNHNANESGKLVLMNHWSPKRPEIVYYLSDEFAKPENAKIRDLTYKTVQNLNDGLQKSGVSFRINLKDGEGKVPGDIRNSMIVLVEDPVESSVIGYGPQTEDPVTGEIISARTVMFLGSIKQYVKYTYDAILRENKQAELEAKQKANPVPQPQAGAPGEKPGTGTASKLALSAESLKKIKAAKTKLSTMGNKKPNLLAKKQAQKKSSNKINMVSLKEQIRTIRNYTARNNGIYDRSIEGQLRYLQEVKNCAYNAGDEISTSGISPKLARQFAGPRKPWEELSEAEKQAATDIILPEIWIPTLIHELGHNLGLRHNFQGSEDKANFYSENELAALGIDHKVPFSSVMEYGDDLKALPVLGKYDIAALQFGYLRQVETVDGGKVQLEENLSKLIKTKTAQKEELKLKDYGYCTDEHTGINAGCRRFDLGTNYTEITQSLIQSYLDRYERDHFRMDRANFSLVGDIGAAGTAYRQFLSMRLMQEVYTRLGDIVDLPADAPEWKEDPEGFKFVQDLKQASTLAGQFLLDVLQTQDLHCIIKTPDANAKPIVQRLADFEAGVAKCTDIQLKEGYSHIGSYGRLFNSIKTRASENPWADQIDVRGYWIDKLMAARVLFARNLNISTLDTDTQNFADRLDMVADIETVLMEQMSNQNTREQVVEFVDGTSGYAAVDTETYESQIIAKPLFSGLARVLGIPNYAASFNQVLAYEVATKMVSAEHQVDGKEFSDMFRVLRRDAAAPIAGQDIRTHQIGDSVLIATPANVVAYEAMGKYEITSALDRVPRKQLQEILSAREKDPKIQKPAGLTPELEVAWTVDMNFALGYFIGMYTSDFYSKTINFLPN